MEEKHFNLIIQELKEIKDSQVRMEERIGRIEERQDRMEERIGKIEERQDKMEKKLTILDERQKTQFISVMHEIHELNKKIDKQTAVMQGQIRTVLGQMMEVTRMFEERFYDIEEELAGIHDDIKTITVLLQINKEQHEEYDRILNIKRA